MTIATGNPRGYPTTMSSTLAARWSQTSAVGVTAAYCVRMCSLLWLRSRTLLIRISTNRRFVWRRSRRRAMLRKPHTHTATHCELIHSTRTCLCMCAHTLCFRDEVCVALCRVYAYLVHMVRVCTFMYGCESHANASQRDARVRESEKRITLGRMYPREYVCQSAIPRCMCTQRTVGEHKHTRTHKQYINK